MLQTEEYKTLVSIAIEQNEELFIIVAQLPFWLKTLINSGIINRRDNTKHFILLLNITSNDAWEHGLESTLRFYWKPIDECVIAKKISNFLSFLFGLIILGVIVNEFVEYWMSNN